jgi:hypothetical protein
MKRRIPAVAGLALAALFSMAATGPSASAADPDPCSTGGFVRVATGDMGSSAIITSPYDVQYDTKNKWFNDGVQGADHKMQWEMGWNGSTKIARFCANNLGAIGRTSLSFGAVLLQSDGNRYPISGPTSVTAGAGWTAVTSSDVQPGGLDPNGYWTATLAETWSNDSVYAESNVTLHRHG